MASSFKNYGLDVGVLDDATGNMYTASGVTAVIHAVYISNKSVTNYGNVDVKITTDGGTTFHHVAKSTQIEPENTLILDKPVNLEANDILRVVGELNSDSSQPEMEAVAAILEVT